MVHVNWSRMSKKNAKARHKQRHAMLLARAAEDAKKLKKKKDKKESKVGDSRSRSPAQLVPHLAPPAHPASFA